MDSTAGHLGGDFTGKWFPGLKAKIRTGGLHGVCPAANSFLRFLLESENMYKNHKGTCVETTGSEGLQKRKDPD